VPQAGMQLETIRVAGLKGIGGAKFYKNAAMLPAGLLDSRGILRRHNFGVAFGVGGYASGPMMLLAWLHRIPTVVFEPNVEPGFTNRILAGLATRLAVASEQTAVRFGRKAVVTGVPIRSEFFAIPSKEHRPPFRLLITGGSRGALPINQTVIDAMDRLAARKNELFIVHQTGERDYNAVRVAYARREFQAEVVPFIENMAERFAQADLIVCRSGAITVAEVSASGRAAIFIPFGASTDAHQTRNAQVMQDAGAAKLLPQEKLNAESLTHEIFSLLDQPGKIQEMEKRSRSLARPRAVQDIVDVIEEVARR
jgi:UDP-N-acetylglucosamine--N-acetylmuramyl-(pentapeptide) pyrophosphoryl-undecaprenol N-acetylglucosamine transferase